MSQELEQELETVKAGARHSRTDTAMVQRIHDEAVGLGASCGQEEEMGQALGEEMKEQEPPAFQVFKDKRGRWRWVGVTSTAYLDRDGEHFSASALKADAERMDSEGRFGVLRWWHEGEPDPSAWASKEGKPWGAGIDFGTCDFSWALGPFGIESGTFYREDVGEAVGKIAPQLEFSRGVHYAPSQRDANGVFRAIKTFERSLLPKGRASNLLTSLTVSQKDGDMPSNAEKLKELEGLIGADLVGAMLEDLGKTRSVAKALGLSLKEMSDEEEAEAAKASKKKFPFMAPDDDEEEDAEGEEEEMPKKGKKKEAPALDQAALIEAVKAANAPLLEALKADVVTAFKAMQEQQTALSKQAEEQGAALKSLSDRLAELEGSQPRGLAGMFGYRASQDPANTPTGEATKAAPSNDSPLLNMLLGGNGQHATPPQ